ncbi:hypothetical protein, partial [Salmonella enterica]|uniref:hypothetical protein n=2 Tax=Salmonella enterica TaxID=28901 RepID=UPI001961118C
KGIGVKINAAVFSYHMLLPRFIDYFTWGIVIGVRLENGKYPTLSLFLKQVWWAVLSDADVILPSLAVLI